VAEKREKPESMNAFALISRSQGFNLGNLFEKEMMVNFSALNLLYPHIWNIVEISYNYIGENCAVDCLLL
jgi:hypothetical protein